MVTKLKAVKKILFGLPLVEATFQARGFETGYEAQPRLELVAKTVVNGYNVALETGLGEDLKANTLMVKDELVGFFNEGIGMGLYTLDLFSLNGTRFWQFVEGPGKNHKYMSFIGAGLACGVFKRPFNKFLDKACPMSGSLILDGIGFYYAYFKPQKTLNGLYVPQSVQRDAYFLERYDNGIGRALWFYNAGEPERIARSVAGFPAARRAGVWSGVGLAATYAGGVSKDKIRLLKALAGEHAVMLAQGSILATHTRHTAGNPHQDDTTERILIGRSGVEAHSFAVETIKFLDGRRYIDGKHSFQVFLEHLRKWVSTTNPTLNAEVSGMARY